ncbi:uncharacterized protein N7482_003380 [Penicillium canariense]|uniref:Uncharacterized protein n=1 Tax=Penicillium canariense TaxID=189055 RepID=A0A9W9LP38_9EURO|nr:uncharacterized protein N7482_003380 [Penicillium canariense]KAJ5167786.1 hypothetical protein N7482_003380 [Penicillium canariense]
MARLTLHFALRGPPTSSSRRRNGKPASCEPCRRDKDRDISARCFYHPAPLTRPRGRRIFPLAEGIPFDRAALARYVKL